MHDGGGYDEFGERFGQLSYKDSFSHYIIRVGTGLSAISVPAVRVGNSKQRHHGARARRRVDDEGPDFQSLSKFSCSVATGRTSGPPTATFARQAIHVVMDGKLVKRHCIQSSSERTGEQWVIAEVEVRGDKVIRHKIDGKTVLEYTRPATRRGERTRKRSPTKPGILLKGGTISLQSKSHPCDFRKVELLVLDGDQ